MKIILSLLLIVVLIGFVIAEAHAECSNGNCRGVQRYIATADYTGSQYDIKIPDLFINTSSCEQKASVATTWLNIEPSRENVQQWIEAGVTVGWIKNNDFGRDDSECISVESAYYGISAFDVDPDERTIEQNADPHGDVIGIEKRFRIEKQNNHYLAYYGDSNTQDLIRDYDFGERHRGIYVDYGVEGTISPILVNSPVLEYSTIPNTQFTDAQYKIGNTWNDVSSFAVTSINDENDGYKSQICGTGHIVAGAVTELDCNASTVPNTAPTHTATNTYTTTGTAVIIPLTASDADNDYLSYLLVNHPTNNDGTGTLDHVSKSINIPNTDDTSSKLLFTPTRAGISSFDYSVTDGRTGHTNTNTITIDIESLDDISTTDIFSDKFESGFGNWLTVDDDDGDTHDYDFWTTGTDGQTSSIDGNYAYIRDCDTGCTLTMRNAIDISDTESPKIEADIWVDGIRESDGDFYNLEIFYNNWITLDSYTRDTISNRQWHQYSQDLSSYKSNNFKFRLNVQGEGSSDYHIIDNVRIYDFIQSEPAKITDLQATATPTSTNLTWSTPFDGNSAITGYKIQRAINSPNSYNTIQNSYGDVSIVSYVDTSVTSGINYYYKVSARNDQGTASESQPAMITVPYPPTNPVISSISDITMSETDIAIITVTVSDVNEDVASITFTGLPEFVTEDETTQNTSTLVISPTTESDGVYDVVVIATDSGGLTDTENFRLTVTDYVPPDTTNPSISILSPLDGSSFDDNSAISFTGNSIDDVDGDISDSITWSSDVDGAIGTGSSVSSTLSIGVQTITATSTDLSTNTSTDSITLTIQNTQEDITSSTGTGNITLVTNSGYFSTTSAIPESTLPDAGKPNVTFPDGLVSWSVSGLNNGDTITVTMTLPNDVPTNSQYWKVIENTWTDATTLLGSNDGDDIITLTITDGGTFDADGLINGHITDPGGIAIPITSTNTPPIAVNDVIVSTAIQGIPFEIDTSSILANDSDADGDTITVQSVDNTSANFGIVSLSDNTITYTSSNSFTGDDIFSYTITDGTDTDSAVVTVTVIEQPTSDGVFVYVIDNYSKEMTKFDDTGNYLNTITGFIGPFDVDTDESGNIYAAATNWHRVQKYDTNDNLILTIQGIGTTESLNDLSSLYAPHGTAVDDNTGDIYSVTWAGFVQKFDGAGNYITHWGTKGTDDGQFNQPNGIATDSDGNVYVADRLNHRIQKFDGVGNHLLSFGELGRENGQFDWPSKVSVDDTNNVYVADSYNSRIQKFDVMGNHLLTIKMPDSDSMDWVADVDTDSEGNIYAIDQRHYRIVKFDSVGNFVTSWAYGPFDRIIGIAVVG